MDPDEWSTGLRYRSAYATADDAARHILGVNCDGAVLTQRLAVLRVELVRDLVRDDDPHQDIIRDAIDDALAGRRPAF